MRSSQKLSILLHRAGREVTIEAHRRSHGRSRFCRLCALRAAIGVRRLPILRRVVPGERVGIGRQTAVNAAVFVVVLRLATFLGRVHLEKVLVAIPAALVARINLDAEAAVEILAS